MSEQAEARREEILARAEADASAIRESARARAEARTQEGLAALERELETLGARSRERAEAEAHMVQFTTRDTIADELLGDVEKRLAEVAAGDGFGSILEALLSELMQDVQPGMVVLAPSAHTDHAKQWLDTNGHGDLTVQPEPTLKDGVAIQDADRTYRVTNTLSARFRLQQDTLRRIALERLFGGEKH
jgi:vacuolar-type H+-ATPase subunit E/Vma4